jgi:hypothetical protein
MQPEGSLLCWQQPASSPYPEPDQSSQCPSPSHFLKIHNAVKNYFCHIKSNLCLWMFPRRIPISYYNCAISHRFCATEFFEMQFLRMYFYLSPCRNVLNIAEARHYILHIVWEWKLNHNKDSRHVTPITDSQTVQAQTCTYTLRHESNRKFCLRNPALLVVCRTALWSVASVVCSF